MEGNNTPHSSPSQTGGLLSAATAPPLTTGAGLETANASTVPSLPVKPHLTTLLAGGWSCRAPSVDRFLREGSPGDKQEQESKQGWMVLTNMERSCLLCAYSQPHSRWDTPTHTHTHICTCTYGTRHNKVSTQRPYARIQVRASDKCTNGRPQMHEWASEANGYGRPNILKQASNRTNTECAKWWRIPANNTYVIPANDT